MKEKMKDNVKIKKKRIKGKKKFQKKLICSYVILNVLIIFIGIFSYTMASNAIIKHYRENSLQSVEMTGQYLAYGLSNLQSLSLEYLMDPELTGYLSGMSSDVTYYNSFRKELVTKVSAEPFVNAIYILTDKAQSVASSGITVSNPYKQYLESDQGVKITQDRTKFYWFGEDSVLDTLYETEDQNSYAFRMIKNYNNKEYMIVLDVDRQQIMGILSGLDFGDQSYVWLVMEDGTEFMKDGTRQTSFCDSQFLVESQRAEQTAGVIQNVSYQSDSYMYLYTKVGNTGITLCALIPDGEILAQVNTIKLFTIIMVILSVIIASILSTAISFHVNKVIQNINEKITCVTEGDLTVRIGLHCKDEFGDMANQVDMMVAGMEELVTVMQNVNDKVIHTASRVSDSVASLITASTEISSQVNEIDQGLEKQAEDTVECVQKMDHLAIHIGAIEKMTDEITEMTHETKVSIQQSISKMEILGVKSSEAAGITQKVVSSVKILHENTNQMNSILETIDKIVDETSLLALNASIEASRAGESGKGFCVVAESMKKLANMSKKAIESTSEIVMQLMETSNHTAQLAETADQYIIEQGEAETELVASNEKMKKQMELYIDKLKTMLQSINDMQVEKTESIQNIENISAVTEEVVASISYVNENTRQEKNQVDALDEISRDMIEQMKLLTDAIQRFHINK